MIGLVINTVAVLHTVNYSNRRKFPCQQQNEYDDRQNNTTEFPKTGMLPDMLSNSRIPLLRLAAENPRIIKGFKQIYVITPRNQFQYTDDKTIQLEI